MMASKVGEAYLEITAKNAKLKSSMKDSEKAGKSFTKRMQASLARFGKIAFIGAIAGFTALAAAMLKATRAAAVEQVQTQQLAHQLGRLGLNAKRAMHEVNALADAQQSMTRFGDTQTRAMLAQMVMLTDDYEGSMRNLKLAQDMAESGMFDQRSAARYLGMAMQGNIEMLGRYIPELKTSVNESLKQMSASQKAAYAVELLDKKFGGLAKTIGDTTAGGWAKLTNAISDAWEALGTGMLEETGSGLDGITKSLKKMEPELKVIGGLIGDVVGGFLKLAKGYGEFLAGKKKPTDVWYMGPAWMVGAAIAQKKAREIKAVQKDLTKTTIAEMTHLTEKYREKFRAQASAVGMSAKEQSKWLREVETPLDHLTTGVTTASDAQDAFNASVKRSTGALREFGKEGKKLGKAPIIAGWDWRTEADAKRESLERAEKKHLEAKRTLNNRLLQLDREYFEAVGDNEAAQQIEIKQRYKEQQRLAKGHQEVLKRLARNFTAEMAKFRFKPYEIPITSIVDLEVGELKMEPYKRSEPEPVKKTSRPRWMGAEDVWKQAMTAGIKDPVLQEEKRHTLQFDDMKGLLKLVADNTSSGFMLE